MAKMKVTPNRMRKAMGQIIFSLKWEDRRECEMNKMEQEFYEQNKQVQSGLIPIGELSIYDCFIIQLNVIKKERMKIRGESRQANRNKTPLLNPPSFKDRKRTIINRICPNPPNETLIGPDFLITPKLPQVSSTSWCLCDAATNKFIGFRQNHQREVASLTKIMTTIVVLNLLERYSMDKETVIKVSKSAAQLNGTSAQLRHASWVRVGDLMYGAMLPSGNDAAYLLAQVFGLLLFYESVKPQQKEYQDIQSIDICLYDNTLTFVTRFLKEMNRMARQLKMYRTNFANPHGLANVLNVSTAADMMVLSKYACQNQEFRKIMNTQEYTCEFLSQDLEDVIEVKQWKNTNKLLWKGWEGIKTGQTLPAGSCLASLHQDVFIVALNCNNIEARFEQTSVIWNWYKDLSYNK